MAYLKNYDDLGVRTSRSFADCNIFEMFCICKIFIDKRIAQSLCSSRATCMIWHDTCGTRLQPRHQ